MFGIYLISMFYIYTVLYKYRVNTNTLEHASINPFL